MAKQKLSDEEVKKLGAEFLVQFKDKMIGAGANGEQIVSTIHTMAMAITLDGVGTGPGSRELLTDILNGLRKTYLEEWEERVEQKK